MSKFMHKISFVLNLIYAPKHWKGAIPSSLNWIVCSFLVYLKSIVILDVNTRDCPGSGFITANR